MKKLVYIIFGILVVGFTSCVDDYQDANDPPLLDGPAATDAIPASSEISAPGESVDITVTVVDAPAGIDSASVLATDDLGVDRGGSAVLTSGKGTMKGDVMVKFTSDECYSGDLTLAVIVWDGQVDKDGEDAAKGSDPIDVDVTVLPPGPCGDYAGTYDVTGTILVDDFGSGPYSYTEDITLRDCCVDGVYGIVDITGGLYTNDYAAAYGTDPAAAAITVAENGDITWGGVSDQFGGEIIQDPAGSMSHYDDVTKTFTIEWTATAYGERGVTTIVLQ